MPGKKAAPGNTRPFDNAELGDRISRLEDRVHEVKNLLYVTLFFGAVLLAIVLGAILRAYFG